MSAPLFGTDGIRGRVGREPLTPPTLARLGGAIGAVMHDRGLRPRVLLGRDPRRSGPMVGGALLSGLLAAGIDVTVGGVLPTPAVARLSRKRRAGAGIVVSASHNPAGDNGVKIFLGTGRKADPGFEAAVAERLEDDPAAGGGTPGSYRAWPEATDAYVEQVLRDFPDLSLAGLRIAVDCANGAMSGPAPEALRSLGAEVAALHAAPNGANINRRCGALHPKVVGRAVARTGADVGITFDGDGDRCLFADEGGRVLDGDAVLAVLARDLLDRGRLPRRTVVATVMSNLGLERSLEEIGARLVRTAVGDKHVVARMAEGRFALGGEQSGHLVVRRGTRLIGDGLETALHLLAALVRAGGPLGEMAACFTRCPQCLVNVPVRERTPLAEIPSVHSAIREAEASLAGDGRVLVRYSGTEPLARVMVEGPGRAVTRRTAERIAAAIDTEIGSER
jgi:phosphoglucosamine mutase